ncbi:MAG: arabinogalactan endo-1,4-beta-galactosidase [Bacteroidales bacterium]|nr:arabinogalactan endo-1,4-beta-galactosidase [Bacteroidales bacterium]
MKRFHVICTMKKGMIGWAFAAFLMVVACQKHSSTSQSTMIFAKGADISWVTQMEAMGHKFYNLSGEERECTALFKEIGGNAIRLRVWVNPADGWCGQDDVLIKAKRAQALGMRVMIDFHYSDSWADPGKQTVPTAWRGLDPAGIAEAVATHTREVLQSLRNAGVQVSWVQVGNETTNGMLWESGRVSGTKVGEFVRYFKAGSDAVKAIYPQAQVILHLDNGWDLDTLNWFLTLTRAQGLNYDILGLSLYPSYWTDGSYPDWTPKTERFVHNLPLLYQNYGKPIILVEFGMPAVEPIEAKAALEYILQHTRHYDYFQGVFLWEPEAEHKRIGYDYGAFQDGKPTAALDPFGK